ncbi:MAG: hypothetical protein WBL45_06870, partial [Solirubrobacterales bacterium]
MSRNPIHILCLVLALGLLAIPGSSLGSPSGPGIDGASERSAPSASSSAKRAKKRCRWVQAKGRSTKRRVCKKRKPTRPANRQPGVPAGPPPPAPAGPGAPYSPAPGGDEPDYEDPELPGGEPGTQYETVDLISDNGFEDVGRPTGCFDPFNDNDGDVAGDITAPIAGLNSLSAGVSRFGRVGCIHEYGFHEGPIGKSVTVDGKLRIDSPTSGSAPLKVCAIVYLEDSQEQESRCRTVTASERGVLPIHLVKETEDKRLARVFFQLEAAGTAIEATLDDAHLVVEQVRGSEG